MLITKIRVITSDKRSNGSDTGFNTSLIRLQYNYEIIVLIIMLRCSCRDICFVRFLRHRLLWHHRHDLEPGIRDGIYLVAYA